MLNKNHKNHIIIKKIFHMGSKKICLDNVLNLVFEEYNNKSK